MDEDELVRAIKESYLFEVRRAVERNITAISKANGDYIADDEGFSRLLLSMEDTRPFDYSIPAVVDEHDTPILGGHHPRPLIPLHHRKILVPLFS